MPGVEGGRRGSPPPLHKAHQGAEPVEETAPIANSPPRLLEESPAADGATERRSQSSAASARQLGATLWEIQDVIRSRGAGRRIRKRARRGLAAASPRHDDGGGVDRVHLHDAEGMPGVGGGRRGPGSLVGGARGSLFFLQPGAPRVELRR